MQAQSRAGPLAASVNTRLGLPGSALAKRQGSGTRFRGSTSPKASRAGTQQQQQPPYSPPFLNPRPRPVASTHTHLLARSSPNAPQAGTHWAAAAAVLQPQGSQPARTHLRKSTKDARLSTVSVSIACPSFLKRRTRRCGSFSRARSSALTPAAQPTVGEVGHQQCSAQQSNRPADQCACTHAGMHACGRFVGEPLPRLGSGGAPLNIAMMRLAGEAGTGRGAHHRCPAAHNCGRCRARSGTAAPD